MNSTTVRSQSTISLPATTPHNHKMVQQRNMRSLPEGKWSVCVTAGADSETNTINVRHTVIRWCSYIHDNMADYAALRYRELYCEGLTPEDANLLIRREISGFLLYLTRNYHYVTFIGFDKMVPGDDGVMPSACLEDDSIDSRDIDIQLLARDSDGTFYGLYIYVDSCENIPELQQDYTFTGDDSSYRTIQFMRDHRFQQDGVGIVYDDRYSDSIFFYHPRGSHFRSRSYDIDALRLSY